MNAQGKADGKRNGESSQFTSIPDDPQSPAFLGASVETPWDNPEIPTTPNLRSLARALVKGVGILMGAGVVVRFFSVISAPILTRLVGPSPYGVLALIGTVSSLASYVALMGIDMSYARFFFVGRSSQSVAVERFCWRFALGLGVLLSIGATAFWWLLVPAGSTHQGLAFMVGITTLVAVASVMAATRQRIRGAYARIALATLVGSGAGVLISVFLARFWRPDAWAMLTGTLAGSIISLAILGFPKVQVLFQKSDLDLERRKGILSLGLASLATAPMFWVINSADKWLLGIWKGAGAVGIYSFAVSLGLSGMLVNSAITTAWFPEVSREFECSGVEAPSNIARLWARLAGLHMVTWLAVTAAGGDILRGLADARFHDGAKLIPWIAGGVFFYGIADLANTGLFLKKDLKPTAAWWVVGATFNLAANALWIRPYGMQGAAVIGWLTFAVIGLGMLGSAQSRLSLPLPWVRLGIAATATLIAGILMAFPWGSTAWVSLLYKFPIGVLISGLLGVLLAPDWSRRLLHMESWRSLA